MIPLYWIGLRTNADMKQMASIQEQLKQIREASDDWYDEHRRYVTPSQSISILANVVNRIVGELVQASRGTTPDPSSKEPSLKSPKSITQTITTTEDAAEDETA